MNSMLRTSIAAVLIGGAALVSAAPAAFAGADEAQEYSFWANQSASASASAPASGTRSGEYRATYAQPTNTQPVARSDVQKDPPSFYHAMGTMGVP